MKLKLLLLIILVFFTHYLVILSQVNFQEAYVVSIKGDTIHGLIDYKNWNINPSKIKFKARNDSKSIEYTKMDIISFYVAGEIYEKHIVSIDISPYENLDVIRFEPTPLMQKDTVFLSLIVRGKANLFFLKDQFAKDHYFIQKGDNPTEELINYRYYTKDIQYGGRIMKTNKKYLGQLVYYFNDYPEYSTRISGTEYNMQSIKKLFTLYNQRWNDDKSDYVRKTKKIETKFSIGAGMTFTSIKISNTADIEYLNEEFPSSNNLTMGGTLNFIFPRSRQKIGAFVDFYLKGYNSTVYYTDFTYEEFYTDYEVNLGKIYLKIGHGFRYNLLDKKIKPSITGGIFISKAFLSSSYRKTHKVFYSTITDTEEPLAFDDEPTTELGAFGGIGFNYKKFFLDFRYEYSWNVGGNQGVGIKTHILSSTISYMF